MPSGSELADALKVTTVPVYGFVGECVKEATGILTKVYSYAKKPCAVWTVILIS